MNIKNFLINFFFQKIYLRNFSTIDYYLLINVNRQNSNEQNIVTFLNNIINNF